MAKTRQQKEIEVKNLVDSFADAKAVVFTTFSNLTVADSRNLRNDLRNEGVSYLSSKKTLLRKVLANQQVGEIGLDDFTGNVGLAFGKNDEVAPAKIVAKFAKGKEGLVIRGGILEGAFITAEKVMELAQLPSREALLAQTVRTIQAPISGFVNVLAGNLRGLVNVLNAVKDSRN